MIVAEDLHRSEHGLDIVRGVSFTIERGEHVAMVGPSGSGKTTLLQMLGLLDRPNRGRVSFDGEDAWSASAGRRARLRLERIGFVFQQHNLLEHLSARENVALPAWRLGRARGPALAKADALLDRLGLAARRDARARALSVGEAQRVAIARALVNEPAIVLADEPTGSLDSASAQAVLEALAGCPTLLVVTHDVDVAGSAKRIVKLRDGLLE